MIASHQIETKKYLLERRGKFHQFNFYDVLHTMLDDGVFLHLDGNTLSHHDINTFFDHKSRCINGETGPRYSRNNFRFFRLGNNLNIGLNAWLRNNCVTGKAGRGGDPKPISKGTPLASLTGLYHEGVLGWAPLEGQDSPERIWWLLARGLGYEFTGRTERKPAAPTSTTLMPTPHPHSTLLVSPSTSYTVPSVEIQYMGPAVHPHPHPYSHSHSTPPPRPSPSHSIMAPSSVSSLIHLPPPPLPSPAPAISAPLSTSEYVFQPSTPDILSFLADYPGPPGAPLAQDEETPTVHMSEINPPFSTGHTTQTVTIKGDWDWLSRIEQDRAAQFELRLLYCQSERPCAHLSHVLTLQSVSISKKKLIVDVPAHPDGNALIASFWKGNQMTQPGSFLHFKFGITSETLTEPRKKIKTEPSEKPPTPPVPHGYDYTSEHLFSRFNPHKTEPESHKYPRQPTWMNLHRRQPSTPRQGPGLIRPLKKLGQGEPAEPGTPL
eukprot:TRINITY_DN4593_c0_g1_i1.p1 TRINITY_DN4593_c0_g1~~TRINITY_DN4593_c0_g1_i1.p1  ORF type:complete len:533 (-),score=99.87 TRINITY_DN4593_c0_g1_i1:32-1510(-)